MKKNRQEKDRPGIITLMYHRVNVADTDPWGICVSPENFEEQVKVLKANFDVISVDDLVNRLTCGNTSTNEVCITFDDGYADNILYAKPVLENYNCPATFFIATGFIDQPGFWWDELETIFLHSKLLPRQLILEMGGKPETFLITDEVLSPEQWLQHKRWRWYQPPPTSRCSIYIYIWEKLRAMESDSIISVMSKIKAWGGYEERNNNSRLPVKARQLHDLVKNNLFRIAAHTHTHCDLSKGSGNIQREEILASKNYLLENYGVESNFLSYPFGRYNDDTLALVNDLQLGACFTTAANNITTGVDKNLLGRYQVFNWNGVAFEKQIRKWLTWPVQAV